MEKWNYQVVRANSDDDFATELSKMGADGWRVVTATIPPGGGQYFALMERADVPTLSVDELRAAARPKPDRSRS